MILVLPYVHGPVALRPYTPYYARLAEMVAALIVAADPLLVVDHVGSTAVPGCRGRDIVDLAVAYPPGGLADARDVVDGLGFQRQPTRDPFPENRPMRVGASVVDGMYLRLHVHVLERDGDEHREMRDLRDVLRRAPALAEGYASCKRALVTAGLVDAIDYAVAKGAFIEGLMVGLNHR